MHYQRLKAHGNFDPPQRKSVAERFEGKVNRDGSIPIHRPELGACWLWIGGKYKNGYGAFTEAWRPTKNILAHRKSYMLYVGTIPAGLYVLHACDNRLCVRPEHLFLGTQRDNLLDMHQKGRANHPKATESFKLEHYYGERSPHAKLTNADVRRIRELYAEGFATQQQLAEQFGLVRQYVSRIVRRIAWPHLS